MVVVGYTELRDLTQAELTLLPDDERNREFGSEHRRRQFHCGRALLRLLLQEIAVTLTRRSFPSATGPTRKLPSAADRLSAWPPTFAFGVQSRTRASATGWPASSSTRPTTKVAGASWMSKLS